jgi:hypothetical protein
MFLSDAHPCSRFLQVTICRFDPARPAKLERTILDGPVSLHPSAAPTRSPANELNIGSGEGPR